MRFTNMRYATIPLVASFALLFIAAAVVGCDSAGVTEGGAEGETGTLTVRLTDAPGDILEANVTIERVAIVPTEDSASGDADEGGLEVLSDDPMTVDLLTLQNGVTAALGTVEIPEGAYSQIRLITAQDADVYYEDADGQRQQAELMLPSADESGIKISLQEFEIDEASDEVEVTLDFNVEDSFVQRGQMGSYLFKPVVRTESLVVNGEEVLSGDDS
jgi:hypothetical protein